jgi:hypothetical protein
MGCARANVGPPQPPLRKGGEKRARARVREQWSPLTKGGYRGVRGRSSATRALAARDPVAIATARGNRNRSGLPESSKVGNACRSRARRTDLSGTASSRMRWYHGSGVETSRERNSKLAGMSWRNSRFHPTAAGPSDPSDRSGRSHVRSFLPYHKGSGRPERRGHSRMHRGGRWRTRLQSPTPPLPSRPRMTDSSLSPFQKRLLVTEPMSCAILTVYYRISLFQIQVNPRRGFFRPEATQSGKRIAMVVEWNSRCYNRGVRNALAHASMPLPRCGLLSPGPMAAERPGSCPPRYGSTVPVS